MSKRHSSQTCTSDLFGAMMDASPNALLFVDSEGRIQAVNGLFGEFFSVEPDDQIGRPLMELGEAWSREFVEPTSYHEVVTHPFEDRENRFLRDVEVATPTRRFMEASSAPVRKDGAFVGRLWVFRDVTREREITDLKIQYGSLRNADEIKSKFLTVASHQLRTPMNAMRWNLDLLLSGDAGAISAEALGLLRDVYKSLIASLSIVDDMLLAVDIEQRIMNLEKSSVDVSEVVAKVLRDLGRSAALRKQALVFEPPKSVPRLFIDGGRMEKVFSRLVDNAIRYTPDGGRIEVQIFSDKDDVSIAVKDTGVGIPTKDRPRLFERFYRSERAIDLNPDASGLGLFIAKFIVGAHGGKITYEAGKESGSVFTVVLPRRAGGATLSI